MFVVRESSPEDASAVLAIAEHLDTVNLPADKGRIEAILATSAQSFAGSLERSERLYLLVLEDTSAKRVIGTSLIQAQHGTRRAPHVFFQVFNDERYSQTLDRYFVHQALRIGYNYNGPTEIGGLIILPDYRGRPEALGKLLSYSRFLWVAMHRPVFRDQILSELLPPLESDGTSILWEHLGRKFTGLSYQEADVLSANNKEFIQALFPHSVIYTSLLPPEVQRLVGAVGPETRGVEKILRRIGFTYAHQIDPFDGGPHFVANTDDITLVRDARRRRVTSLQVADETWPWTLVAAGGDTPPRFRATAAPCAPRSDKSDELGLTEAVQSLLGVAPGGSVWAVSP